jgi:diketogulonate reductase-like aldo/keto reductase
MRTIDTSVELIDGHRMPLLGLGVFKIEDPETCVNAVRKALDLGYRHVDTAAAYENEAAVGRAVAESDVDREEIFVTTKLWISDFGKEAAPRALDQSLSELNMDYVDLYLLHWPIAQTQQMMDAWEQLQKARDAGKIRSIGVSNFTIKRFGQDFDPHTDETPAVNQVELHPFWQRKDLKEHCRKRGIQLEAYCPLVRATRMDDPTLRALAESYGKSPAQILIRWQLQHDVVAIPKSSHSDRIAENADVYDFELSRQDMTRLDNLDENQSTISWRPHENFY